MIYESIRLNQFQHIVVLTGAGVSVASGLPTFRGPEGIWQKGEISPWTFEHWRHKPKKVWRFFHKLKMQFKDVQPNAAHLALAQAEQDFQGQTWTLLTQNIDGLHYRAGSQNVVEVHGNLDQLFCEQCETHLPWSDRQRSPTKCPLCSHKLRLNVVLFDQDIPAHTEWRAKRALRQCDLFVAIGTSGTVSPASNYVRSAKYQGAKTYLINLEPTDNPYFDRILTGRAEEILPGFFQI